MDNCLTGIVVPTLNTDPCNGKRTSTTCVVHASSITYLELPANSTQEAINNALVVAIAAMAGRITALEAQVIDLDDRLTILEP